MYKKGFFWAVLLAPLLMPASARGEDMGSGEEDPICCESPTSNWYAGVDLTVLKPHLGTLGAGILVYPEVDVTPGFDYEAAPRIWLGWDNADGLGIRARYFTFDAGATQTPPANHPPLALGALELQGTYAWLEAQTLDFEATQRGGLGQLQFQLAGGFRYAKMETGVGAFGTLANLLPLAAGVGMDFEGVGPTVAVDFRRPFGSRGLALVGSARSSWMYGETDLGLTGVLAGFPAGVYADDHLMQINELSLGVEWSRCLARGGKVTLAALWESQAWEWAPVAGLIHQDIGLTGPTVSLSYLR